MSKIEKGKSAAKVQHPPVKTAPVSAPKKAEGPKLHPRERPTKNRSAFAAPVSAKAGAAARRERPTKNRSAFAAAAATNTPSPAPTRADPAQVLGLTGPAERKRFEKLPRPTQARLRSLARNYGASAAARKNLRALAESSGFGRLKPEQQRVALGSLRAAIRGARVGREISALGADGDFRKLSGATQRRTLRALANQGGDVSAREALVKLAGAAGFRRLDPQLQQRMISEVGTARAGRSEARFAGDARTLANDADFRKLPTAVKNRLLDSLKPGVLPDIREQSLQLGASKAFASLGELHQQRVLDLLAPGRLPAEGQSTIAALASTPGFAALSGPERDRMLAYVGGTNPLSTFVRDQLGAQLPGFAAQPAAQQVAALRDFITRQPSAPGVVASLAFPEPAVAPYSLSAPTEVDHAFPSGAAPALRYELNIDGRTVPIFVERNPNAADGMQPSVNDIAEAFARMPAASRPVVKELQVAGHRNPSDAHWAEVYHRPDFRSWMTAGAEGSITIYPTASAETVADTAESFAHESGHTISMRAFGAAGSDAWNAYVQAGVADGFHPSEYSTSSPDEDFAESWALYSKVSGTPWEAELRALMPARFALFDQLRNQLMSGGLRSPQ